MVANTLRTGEKDCGSTQGIKIHESMPKISVIEIIENSWKKD